MSDAEPELLSEIQSSRTLTAKKSKHMIRQELGLILKTVQKTAVGGSRRSVNESSSVQSRFFIQSTFVLLAKLSSGRRHPVVIWVAGDTLCRAAIRCTHMV